MNQKIFTLKIMMFMIIVGLCHHVNAQTNIVTMTGETTNLCFGKSYTYTVNGLSSACKIAYWVSPAGGTIVSTYNWTTDNSMSFS